jgi:hypothetical protein
MNPMNGQYRASIEQKAVLSLHSTFCSSPKQDPSVNFSQTLLLEIGDDCFLPHVFQLISLLYSSVSHLILKNSVVNLANYWDQLITLPHTGLKKNMVARLPVVAKTLWVVATLTLGSWLSQFRHSH